MRSRGVVLDLASGGGEDGSGHAQLFTILVWAPVILAAPRTRLPWTAFFISWAIGSGAWVVAQNITPKQPANPSV